LKLKAFVITFLFVAGVAASVAVAKGPPPGKGKDKGGDASASTTGTTTTEHGKGKDKHKQRTTATCKPTVTFVLKGEFVSAAAGTTAAVTPSAGPAVLGTFEMKVTSANAHGRQFVGQTVTVSYDKKTSFKRRGHADIDDFEAGDWLNVHVRGCKPAKTSSGDDDSSTTTTTAPTAPATQELLLAKQVIGKPSTSSTTTTTTTSP
jgi:hypothetical protein